MKEVPAEQNNKVPHSRVFIHFFAGTTHEKNIIFMRYDTRNNRSLAFEMLDLMKEGARKRLHRSMLGLNTSANKLIPDKIKPSRKKNGLNLFDHPFDEF
jgi:hypothetical protein